MAMEIIDKLELGVVYDLQGKIINHRSLLKVILNPFLRMFFGYNIATLCDIKKNKLYGLKLLPCNFKSKIKFIYDNNGDYTIVKKRILF